MARRNSYSIIKYPARILATPAEDVFFDKDYFDKMMVRFRRANQLVDGYAIAAPQLGISKRFFYFNFEGEEFLAINPVVLSSPPAEEVATEGCLSIPGKEYVATRLTEINWTYRDHNGNFRDECATGLKARIIQHEVDHLDGFCLPDRFIEA